MKKNTIGIGSILNRFLVMILLGFQPMILADSLQNHNALTAAEATLKDPPAPIKAALSSRPNVYQFNSRFDSTSSVSYRGQCLRHLLLRDGQQWIEGLESSGRPDSLANNIKVLQSYYDFKSDAYSPIDGFAHGFAAISWLPEAIDGQILPIKEGSYYSDIQYPGSQLRNKTAGNDNPLRRGALYGVPEFWLGTALKEVDSDGLHDGFIEPEDLIEVILKGIGERNFNGDLFVVGRETVSEATITPTGYDLGVLYHSFVLGAVAYSQAAGDYLSTGLGENKGINASNSSLYSPGANYTYLEHHFDEAFGYFGAARNFLSYTKEQVAQKLNIDGDGDQLISLNEEANFDYIVSLSQTEGGFLLAREIMGYFLDGRHLITTQPEGYRDYLYSLTRVLLAKWETSLGLLVYQALVQLEVQLKSDPISEFSFKAASQAYSLAKGLGLAFQFSPISLMSDRDFDEFHDLLGDQWPMAPDTQQEYLGRLTKAKDILANNYNF